MISRSLLESVLSEEPIYEAVEVRGADKYLYTHGKQPSGRGHWMFGLGPKSNHENSNGTLNHDQVFSHSGTYGEAKAAAKKHAASLGHKEIHVLT